LFSDGTNDKCQELLAKKTYELTNAALKAIPALSPREEEWLKKEINSGNPDRRIKAISSIENIRQKIISLLTAIMDTATILTDSQKKKTQPNKALLWALILSHTNKIAGDELNLLKQNGIDTNLDELFGGSCDKDTNRDYNYGDCIEFNKRFFYMRFIIDAFLLPELQKIKHFD